MIESWRWFGPLDAITLPEIAQTGATGIVTALHEISYGEVWPREAIAARIAKGTAYQAEPVVLDPEAEQRLQALLS